MLMLIAGAAAYGQGAQAPRTDLYGDPLPPGAVARLGTIQLRHTGAHVTFSPDGKRLISYGWNGELRVWDAASGKLVRRKRLGPRGTAPLSEALSPGGAKAAAWDGSAVRVYDTAIGNELRRLPAHSGSLLTFSPDGKMLTVAQQAYPFRIQLWDLARGKIRRVMNGPDWNEQPFDIAVAPDGKHLAGISRAEDHDPDDPCTLHLWDATTGREVGKKDRIETRDGSVAFSPDGKTLAVGDYGEVRLLDVGTLKEKAALRAEVGPFDRLAFSPDGRFLAGAYGGRPGGWWVRQPLLKWSGILLWDLRGAQKPRRLPGAGIDARLAFAPDGKTLAYVSEGFVASEIRLWDVARGRLLLHRPGHGTPARALAVSPDGKLVASDAEDALYLWKAATGELLREWGGPDHSSHACLFSPDGKWLISADHEGALEAWDVATGKELRRFKIDASLEVQAASISGGGKRLAVVLSVEGRHPSADLLVWDLITGDQLTYRSYNLEVHAPADEELHGPSVVSHAAFAPDGEVMSVWLGAKVGLEEVSTGRLRAALPAGVGRPLVFSPDGRLVAAALLRPKGNPYFGANREGVSLIETATGEEIVGLEIGEFECMAFTPDGRGLVVADRKSLRIWDADTGERLHQRAWPDSIRDGRGEVEVHSLAVLPGGRALTGMEEGDILVWDLAPASWSAGKPVRHLRREELDALWSDLDGKAREAHHALHTLATAPAQALPLLRDRLRPATAVDAKRVEILLADLDNNNFAAREAAGRELAGLRERIEPALRRALRGKPSLEARSRLRAMLAGPRLLPLAETRRALRAIAALERIGTPEARRLLERLAGGADARETREAKAALQRLNRR
jgi:WD40 repeat protein